MRIILLIQLLLPFTGTFAQSPFFKLWYDQDTMFWSESNFVIEAGNGDVVHISRLLEQSPDTNWLVFRRSDPNGNLLNTTRMVVPGAISPEMLAGMELPDGSFLLFGSAFSDAGVIQLSAQGNLISVRQRNGSTAAYHAATWENDSTILAVGTELGTSTPGLLLSRFDDAGNHLGSRTMVVDGHGTDGRAVIRSASGGAYIAASGLDTINGGGISGGARTCVVRLDDAGNVLWAKRYRYPGHLFYPEGIVENTDGSVLVGGVTWFPGATTHCTLLHLNDQGDVLGAHEYADVLDPNAFFSTRGFMAPTDSTVMFTGFLQLGSFAFTCDRAGTPVTGTHITAVHTLDTPVRSNADDLLIPAAGVPPLVGFSGVALGVWRTADPFALQCSSPLDIVTSDLTIATGQVYTDLPLPMVFDDITAQFTNITRPMIGFDPCISTTVATAACAADERRLWPVPAADRITISAPAIGQVDIIDAAGRHVLSRSGYGRSSVDVGIGHLADGPYVVQITNNGASHALRMIKGAGLP